MAKNSFTGATRTPTETEAAQIEQAAKRLGLPAGNHRVIIDDSYGGSEAFGYERFSTNTKSSDEPDPLPI